MNTIANVDNNSTTSKFKLRDYQVDLSTKGAKLLNNLKFVIYSIEVRCGKTFIALETCKKVNAKKVLFVTKKKAMASIQDDYNTLAPDYTLELINYESLHKVKDKDFDVIICDEIHCLGAYPKPSKRTKNLKQLIQNKRVIGLSGTLTPESFSQIFHIFWISNYTPFKEKSFYKWAKVFVNVTTRKINGYDVNDYSSANIKLIEQYTNKYLISYTQKQAGFTSKVTEEVLVVRMKPTTYDLAKKLKRDRVIEGKNGGVILADTGVKLMQKLHQIYSGTVKLEDGSGFILDNTKAVFLKNRFKNNKIAIFYKYKAELQLLQNVFKDNITTDLTEFNTTNKNIALQIVSGREGVKLAKADFLVFFNIDYSATSYFQAKDRMTTMDRLANKVYWLFSENGIEQDIYRTVKQKKNFTLKYYNDGIKVPSEIS